MGAVARGRPRRTGHHDLRRRYARAVVRGRWAIILVWIAAAAAAVAFLPGIGDAGGGALGSLVPTDSKAVATEKRAAELFRFPTLSRVMVVQRDPQGLSREAKLRAIRRATRLSSDRAPAFRPILAAFPVIGDVGPPAFARQRGTGIVTYLLIDPDRSTRSQTRVAERLAATMDQPGDGTVGVTGAVPAQAAQAKAITDHLPLVSLGTVLVVALAVALHFRALLAPLLTLGSVAIAYVVAVGVVSAIGRDAGLAVPQEVEPVMVVLLFGILTDYAVFFLSRFRRRLADGEAATTAAEGTIADLAGIIAAAGLAVMAGTLSLLTAHLNFFKVFGPGVALSVLIGLLVALTFLPAGLAALGQATFWPTRPGRDVPAAAAEEDREAGARPVRSRSVRLAARHPLATVVGCVVVLLAAATGLRHTEAAQTLIRGLPQDAEARVAYHAATESFTPGVVSPTLVLIQGKGIASHRRALAEVQQRTQDLPGVSLVVGPRQQPLSDRFGVVYAPSGDAVRMLVFLNSNPLGARAIGVVDRLGGQVAYFLFAADLDARVRLAGDTAIAGEIVHGTDADLERITPVALLAVGLVLALLLRSILAPLYLLAASVLALAAALGLTTYVFQGLLGHAELTYYVPFVASVLLLSLGSDYNVFLAGRVWEEAERRPMRDAVEVGGSRAASAITVAGIVLALSFALLALVPVRPFRELAFVMVTGLLLDAFLVRTLLVPAVIALFGSRSAWPRRFRVVATPGPAPIAEGAPSAEHRPAAAIAPPRALRALVLGIVVMWHLVGRRR